MDRERIAAEAVSSVVDDLDERPDSRTIMLMTHAARRGVLFCEQESNASKFFGEKAATSRHGTSSETTK